MVQIYIYIILNFVSRLFGVYSICHESRGRVDKWDTAQIDVIQMACILFLIGLPIRISILDTTNSTKPSFLYTVNEPEDNCGPPKKSAHLKTLPLLKQKLNMPIYGKMP